MNNGIVFFFVVKTTWQEPSTNHTGSGGNAGNLVWFVTMTKYNFYLALQFIKHHDYRKQENIICLFIIYICVKSPSSLYFVFFFVCMSINISLPWLCELAPRQSQLFCRGLAMKYHHQCIKKQPQIVIILMWFCHLC